MSKAQMEKKRTITYRWWNEAGVKPEHEEALEETAWERVLEMTKEGYTSGELCANIGDDDTEYTGWWEKTTETIS